MATLGINIQTNFDQAATELKAFSNLTQAETDRINRSLKKLESFEADAFVQKNKRIALSVGATKGTIAALETEQRGLERQMQMLIRNGMTPQDAALKKLQDEYNKTTRQIEINAKAQKINESISKAATRTMQVLGVAALATGAALLKNAQDTAKRGDTYAKEAAIIGTTAEELQKLNYVAEIGGVKQEAFGGALKKLNKNLGDARMGTGELQTVLEKMNPALLQQLKSTTDTSQAFTLMVDAMRNATNQQEKAALAQAAFGKTGQALIGISNMSAEEIKRLRMEAEKYGIISNSAAKASESYMDAQTRLKAAVTGVRNALGTALMPIIQSVVEGITNFIGDGEKLKSLFKTLAPIIVTVGGALAGMLVVNKVTSLISGFKDSMAALKIVLKAHPIMLLVGGITALAAILPSAGKSAADFEKDIASAEATTKQLQKATFDQAAAYTAFMAAARGAATDSAAYNTAITELLKKTPELAQYGITASSSFDDVTKAQKLLTEAQQAAAITKADEQYKKLVDNLGELKLNMMSAWEAYKNDPTTANLAQAKQYAAQLQRSQVAMQLLGKTSGRSADEIKTAFDTSGSSSAVAELMGKRAAMAMRDIGNAAIMTTNDILNRLFPGITKVMSMVQQFKKGASQTVLPKNYSKPRDMSQDIAKMKATNDMMEQLAGAHARKMAQLEINYNAYVKQIRLDQTITTAQSDALILQSHRKLIMDQKALDDEYVLKRMAQEEEVAKAQIEQEEKVMQTRIAFASQALEGVSSILQGLSGLYTADTTAKVAALEAQQKAELTNTKLTDKEKEALQKEHEKQKAKLEYEGALKSWRLQVAAGVADGARAILSALNTKPFIPAGLAAAAVATAMTGIQIATLKASKPKLSAETGGRFTVPDNGNSSRGDSQTMNVNPGEVVDITPRGESRKLVINNYMNKQLLWSVTQEGIDSGVITITNDNLVAV